MTAEQKRRRDKERQERESAKAAQLRLQQIMKKNRVEAITADPTTLLLRRTLDAVNAVTTQRFTEEVVDSYATPETVTSKSYQGQTIPTGLIKNQPTEQPIPQFPESQAGFRRGPKPSEPRLKM